MNVVAVTACISGIAHTYMAKSGIENACKASGYGCHVETQGAMGIEDRIPQDEIDAADVVIFAVDTTVSERDRFEGKKILEVGTSECVKDAAAVVKRAAELASA